MSQEKKNVKDLKIDTSMNIDLKNFIDKAILQTLIDANENSDEPLKLLDVVPFKGDKMEKTIDELALDESVVIPIIYRKNPSPY